MADETPKPQYVYKTVGDRKLRLDVDYPDGWTKDDKRPAIVFFSGGAWRNGGTGQFRKQAAYFAKRGLVAVRAEYRDRTKDKVEVDTCLKDAITAMRWVRKNAKLLGIDPDRIVASGGSAGGYLAAATFTTEGHHSPDDDLSVSPKPNAMVLFNPVLDLVAMADHPAVNLGGDEALAKRISPSCHMSNDMPPTLILIGSKDGFLGQVKQYVKKASELGAQAELEIYDGQPHAFFNNAPYMAKTVSRADEFLRSLGYLGEEPRVDLPVGKDPAKRRQKKKPARR